MTGVARPLEIRSARVGDCTVVAVRGEIDMATAPQLDQALRALLGQDPVNLELNLSEVSFIDSAGLAVLVSVQRLAQATGGDLVVVERSRQFDRLLSLTGLPFLRKGR